MAISPFKTWSAGEVLTAADLNSSFTQITNNGADLVSPFTKNIAAGGFVLTGLGAGANSGESVRFEQLTAAVAHICEFRLTCSSGNPIPSGDVIGAGSLYCTPYKGNRIALYDGTNWNVRSSAEMSLAGGLTASKPYDIFCYDNAGTPTLEGLVWTNDTTRATALTTQDGVYVKTGAVTRRYLGTIRTNLTGTFVDGAANRWAWNYYNRVLRPMVVLEATDSWNYSTATIRQANGAAANQLDFVIGVSEDIVTADIRVRASDTAAGNGAYVGVGLDVTNVFTTGGLFGQSMIPVNGQPVNVIAWWKGFPGAGRHFLSWNEYAGTSGTMTWYGDNGTPTLIQSGIYGEIWA